MMPVHERPPMIASPPDGFIEKFGITPPPPLENLCPDDLDLVCMEKETRVVFSRPANWSITRGRKYECDYPTDLIPDIFPRGAFINQGNGISCMKDWVSVDRDDFDEAYEFLGSTDFVPVFEPTSTSIPTSEPTDVPTTAPSENQDQTNVTGGENVVVLPTDNSDSTKETPSVPIKIPWWGYVLGVGMGVGGAAIVNRRFSDKSPGERLPLVTKVVTPNDENWRDKMINTYFKQREWRKNTAPMAAQLATLVEEKGEEGIEFAVNFLRSFGYSPNKRMEMFRSINGIRRYWQYLRSLEPEYDSGDYSDEIEIAKKSDPKLPLRQNESEGLISSAYAPSNIQWRKSESEEIIDDVNKSTGGGPGTIQYLP